MGLKRLWEERCFPVLCSFGMGGSGFREQRPHATRGLAGRVLEIGFGAGHNLPHYPPEVTEILALEPSAVSQRMAHKRIEACPHPVRFVGLCGEEIPLEDDSVDAVLSTFTLCTIGDVARALREARRVLAPTGRLHFLEHGLAPDERTARWQRRLTPIQRTWAGGCHFDRAIDELIQDAGFEIEALEQRAMRGPKFAGWLYDGRART